MTSRQTPAAAITAFADVWPKATETEMGATLCAIGAEGTFLLLGGNFLEREQASSKIKEKFEDWVHFLVINPFKDAFNRIYLTF